MLTSHIVASDLAHFSKLNLNNHIYLTIYLTSFKRMLSNTGDLHWVYNHFIDTFCNKPLSGG